MFDDLGRPTPYLETIAEQLGELDAGWQASEGFFAALTRHELIEPLTLEITLDDGTTNRLVGYHGIARSACSSSTPPRLASCTPKGT